MSFQNGMLWFDNSDDDLQVKVKRGAAEYTETRGQPPEICFVHPSITPDGENCTIGNIDVRISQSLLAEYLYFLGNPANGSGSKQEQ